MPEKQFKRTATKNDGLDYRWPIEIDDYGQFDHFCWMMAERKEKPEVQKIAKDRFLTCFDDTCVLPLRENSDCFLTTTSRRPKTSVTASGQRAGTSSRRKAVILRTAFQSFKNSTLQSIFHCRYFELSFSFSFKKVIKGNETFFAVK